MTTSRTSAAKSAARRRAIERRMVMDAERIARDTAVDAATEQFFHQTSQREAVRDQIAVVESHMGAALRQLIALGESQANVITRLEITPEQFRRLRKLHDPPATGQDEPAAPATTPAHEGGGHDARS